MGILDDAIREHLELKRQQGAANNDLERLEQEAFGPATRPGDPEFETGSEPVVGDQADADAEPIADFTTGEEPFSEAATTVAPQVEAPPAEPSPAEQARIEHPHLADTADHPAVEQPLPQAPAPEAAESVPAAADAPPETVEPVEPVEAPEGSIFLDQEAGEREAEAERDVDDIEEVAFEDFEIDLDEQEPGAEPPQANADAPVTQVPFEPAAPGEPAEGFEDTDDDLELEINLDDQPFEEPLTDPGPAIEAMPPGSPVPPPAAAPQEPASEVEFELDEELEDEIEDEDEDEDLLEETPDFLQDAPEGERLWFEQGEPKDFDFDD